MKIFRLPSLLIALALLAGCANNSPYYYGGTSYRMHNIGGLPVSGSIGVHATPKGLMLSPNIVLSPQYLDWKR
ncbi:MAG: hypothetical protein M0Q49_09165 [Porticoccaceae bacterium]|jgi:hypothetical protein|nr:hypothetical protein [Porticoccaceae bacterium]BBE29094.1 hypothetical protein [uncultured bacterium]